MVHNLEGVSYLAENVRAERCGDQSYENGLSALTYHRVTKPVKNSHLQARREYRKIEGDDRDKPANNTGLILFTSYVRARKVVEISLVRL